MSSSHKGGGLLSSANRREHTPVSSASRGNPTSLLRLRLPYPLLAIGILFRQQSTDGNPMQKVSRAGSAAQCTMMVAANLGILSTHLSTRQAIRNWGLVHDTFTHRCGPDFKMGWC